MQGFPILTILIALPLLAALACLFVRAEAARWIALIATVVELVLGILLCCGCVVLMMFMGAAIAAALGGAASQ